MNLISELAPVAGKHNPSEANNTATSSSLPYQNTDFTVESNSTISEFAFITTDWTLSLKASDSSGTMSKLKIPARAK